MLKIGRRRQNRADGSQTTALSFSELQAQKNGTAAATEDTSLGTPDQSGLTELDNPELLMRNGTAFARAC